MAPRVYILYYRVYSIVIFRHKTKKKIGAGSWNFLKLFVSQCVLEYLTFAIILPGQYEIVDVICKPESKFTMKFQPSNLSPPVISKKYLFVSLPLYIF